MTIDLTDEEARLFTAFRRHQDAFSALLTSNAFDTKGGSVVVHFDASGRVRRIDVNIVKVFGNKPQEGV